MATGGQQWIVGTSKGKAAAASRELRHSCVRGETDLHGHDLLLGQDLPSTHARRPTHARRRPTHARRCALRRSLLRRSIGGHRGVAAAAAGR